MNEPDRILRALQSADTVAVVGCSPNPARPSNEVARYLQSQGYRVVPINPAHREILGERCFPSLSEVPADVRIDIVDVFRRPEHVAGVAEQAIARRVPFFVMQLGIVDEASAGRLEGCGIGVAMDRCILVEHRRLGIPRKSRNAVLPTGVSSLSRPWTQN